MGLEGFLKALLEGRNEQQQFGTIVQDWSTAHKLCWIVWVRIKQDVTTPPPDGKKKEREREREREEVGDDSEEHLRTVTTLQEWAPRVQNALQQ
jgi:hypothetical protein